VAAAPSSVPWGLARASAGGAVLAPPLYRASFTQGPSGGEGNGEGGGEDEDEGSGEDESDGESGGAGDGALGATGPGGAGPRQRAAGALAAAVAAGNVQRLSTGSGGSAGSRRSSSGAGAAARASALGLAVQAVARQPGVPGVRYSLLQV
jgi:hypothetical protein